MLWALLISRLPLLALPIGQALGVSALLALASGLAWLSGHLDWSTVIAASIIGGAATYLMADRRPLVAAIVLAVVLSTVYLKAHRDGGQASDARWEVLRAEERKRQKLENDEARRLAEEIERTIDQQAAESDRLAREAAKLGEAGRIVLTPEMAEALGRIRVR